MTPVARPLLQSIRHHAVLLFGLPAILWAVVVVDFLLTQFVVPTACVISLDGLH